MFNLLKRRQPKWMKYAPIALAGLALAVMGVVYLFEKPRLPEPSATTASGDQPPTIEFTWTPLGPVDLKEFKGQLVMKDDNALDFSTYQMRIVEIDKTIGLPIPGVVGKEYTSPVYLGLIADDSRLIDHGSVTLEFSIADDRGQRTMRQYSIALKKATAGSLPVLEFRE
ncbi:MAG: hypothetical protein PHT12_00095 [Patescibacteria group bacterium]|nr:hypothetical protein [Patescibacteria group bacterium]